jgi:prepilin-type N-terminal cleavage/methylation domain-containing protein
MSRDRSGMSLIELLVVVMIIGILAVTVLPSIGGSVDRRRYREAAQNVSAFIARAQSRAINAPAPRGLVIQPLAADPAAAIDVYFANAPEPYGGADYESRVHVVVPSGLGNQATLQFVNRTNPDNPEDRDSLNFIESFCSLGDTIQFSGSGLEYELVPPGSGGPAIRLRADAGQNLRTTAWPRTNPTVGAAYKIVRQPRRASSGVVQLQRGAAIDLGWSCLGSRTLGRGDIIKNPLAPVFVMFDTAGRPLELVHSGGLRTRISAPLFLLIGSSQQAGSDYVPSLAGDEGTDPEDRQGANWQYPDTVWLCLDNNTGIVKYAPVAPNARTVLESQRFIRLSVGLGVTDQ